MKKTITNTELNITCRYSVMIFCAIHLGDNSPSEDQPDGMYPPNITACSSSVIVREKPEQGGGLEPLLDGEDHNPRTQYNMDTTQNNTISNNLSLLSLTSIMSKSHTRVSLQDISGGGWVC